MADNYVVKDGNGVERTITAKEISANVYSPRVLIGNESGTTLGTAGAPVRTDPTGSTTQPVSAASLPLPGGASTAANQATALSSLADILTELQSAVAALQSTLTVSGTVTVGTVPGTAVDDAAFTPGSGVGHPMMAMLDDTSSDTVDEGDTGILRMTSWRAMHVSLRSPDSDSEMGTSGNALHVRSGYNTGNLVNDAACTANITPSDITNQAFGDLFLHLRMPHASDPVGYWEAVGSIDGTNYFALPISIVIDSTTGLAITQTGVTHSTASDPHRITIADTMVANLDCWFGFESPPPRVKFRWVWTSGGSASGTYVTYHQRAV